MRVSSQQLLGLCFAIVVLQSAVILFRRKKTSIVQKVEMAELFGSLASASPCDIDEPKRSLRIGNSPIHGSGVFVTESVRKGQQLEVCPLLRIPSSGRPCLLRYTFRPVDGNDGGLLALGYGSLYNHSYNPNATVHFPQGKGVMVVKASKNLGPGDEVVINYGRAYWRMSAELDAALLYAKSVSVNRGGGQEG